MVQVNNFAVLRIKPSNVRSFEPIAVDASESEVIERGWSAMLPRDNVIDLEWRGM
jgi:hypothetical protein